MSTVSKAFKLLLFPARLPVSLRAPIPHHRPFLPLFRFSSTTTSAPPPPQQERSYGKIPISIAGVQFYNGIANRGESLVLLREPSNPYDRNAIRVDKANGTQVGYVPAYLARNIAPLVDEGLITIGMEATEPRCVMQAASIEVFGVAKTEKRWRELCERGKETWGLWGTYGVAATSTMGLLGNAAEGLLQERMTREETVLDRENTDPLTPSSEAGQKPPHRIKDLHINPNLYFRGSSTDTRTRTPETATKKSAKAAARASKKAIRKRKSMCYYAMIFITVPISHGVKPTGGEKLILRREPRNQAHPHAIRVDSVEGAKIGYIPFSLSTGLAPYVDQGLITLEGRVLVGCPHPCSASIPVAVNVLGPLELLEYYRLKAELIQKGIIGRSASGSTLKDATSVYIIRREESRIG